MGVSWSRGHPITQRWGLSEAGAASPFALSAASPVCRLLRPPHPAEGDPEDPPQLGLGPGAAKLPGRRQKRRGGAMLHPATLVSAEPVSTGRRLSASPWGKHAPAPALGPADSLFLQPATCRSTFLVASHLQKRISFSWRNAEARADPRSIRGVVQDGSLRQVFCSRSFELSALDLCLQPPRAVCAPLSPACPRPGVTGSLVVLPWINSSHGYQAGGKSRGRTQGTVNEAKMGGETSLRKSP